MKNSFVFNVALLMLGSGILPVVVFSQSLSLPVLLSPANNVTNQPSTVTLTWSAPANADQYKVALGVLSVAEGSIVWDTTYVGTSYQVQNLKPGKYYWRIKAKHTPSPYAQSAWSGVWNFTVGSSGGGTLAIPSQLSPAQGASLQSSAVSLSWQAVSGADQYYVSLGNNPNGNGNIVLDTSYSGTSYSKSGLIPGTYYWKIRAKKLSPFQLSDWSVLRSFTLSAGNVGTPVLVSPSNASTLQVPGTNLVWQVVANATYYKVKVATDAAMTNIIFADDNVVNTNRVAQNLNYNTTYYWTVQAANSSMIGTASNPRSFTTMPDNPAAVNTHPRLLFTSTDVPVLQSWAVPSNPVYIALQTALNSAINTYNSKFFPGGISNPVWPDNGGTTWSGYVTESYAEFFAFWSLIDPVIANRPVHAMRARNLLMYVIDQALLGPSGGVPFRDPQFMTYDRSRVYGEACPLTVDWIYNAKDANNNDILTAADKAKIRTVFLRWCSEQLVAWNHPTPVGLMNDKQISLTNRWILNNYYSGHARNMTYMALSMDAIDDAPVDPNLHYSALGNSVRSYIFNATGAWLYQQYAQYEKPEIVAADYGVPVTGIGMGSGGLSIEGSLYGESIGWVAQVVLALKTAGWLDETIIGKQAKLFNSDYWTRVMDGMLHSIAPVPYVPAQASYYGAIYPVANYGDLLRGWMTPFMIDITAPIGLIDMRGGNNQSRLDKTRWFSRNVLEGGSAKLAGRIANVWSNSVATQALYYYLLLDPSGSNPADPRPSVPNVFWDPAFNRMLARTDWTSSARWFDWHCHWTSINHQAGDGNQFEFYRKGEWMIKERSGYTNDNVGTTSEFHNTLALQNTVPPNMQWFEGPISARGGQWKEGLNAGDPKAIVSTNHSEFVYGTGDATNLYNRPDYWNPANAATDIEFASRSIVWLKPDHIVIYDRAKSKTANRFKRFFLQFTAAPNVNGKNVTVTTPGNQKIFISNLLPAASVLTSFPSENINALCELEQTTHELKIEDPSNPSDIRFLNVIQGADANASKDNALLIQSHSGTEFEGAVVNNTAIMFIKIWNAAFSNTSYSIPNSVTAQIVSGLIPSAGYDVALTNNGNNIDVTITPGDDIYADTGGVLFIDNLLLSTRSAPRSANGITNLAINPNPFNGETTIQFELNESAKISLEIYNLEGKKIHSIMHNELKARGIHQLNFENYDIPNGIYVCKLTKGNQQICQRLVIHR